MNPALIILIVIAAILLWFLLSFAFNPLGKLIYRIGKDAVDEMNKEELILQCMLKDLQIRELTSETPNGET